MSEQLTYKVLAPRFFDGVLYKPGEREVIVTDKPFDPLPKDLELISGQVAKAKVKVQRDAADKKKAQVAEANAELAKTKGLSPPNFAGKPAGSGKAGSKLEIL